ncbi:hypothetical protein L484_018378 [Morus notabilis]|uniref:Uncharacterized protein n=1 Tax=Morus notabilis TaxID=981085 RepID=W9QNX9_9ROSA|nr:hypothetical protein L484_018378 [Morus notabilis]
MVVVWPTSLALTGLFWWGSDVYKCRLQTVEEVGNRLSWKIQLACPYRWRPHLGPFTESDHSTNCILLEATANDSEVTFSVANLILPRPFLGLNLYTGSRG